MSQNDFQIAANQSGTSIRQDIQNALQALASTSSGATAPTTTYDGQLWLDTSTNPATIRMRNTGNNAWIAIGTLEANFGMTLAAHGTATAQVHGLPANVHVLGTRTGSGRFVQQGSATPTVTGAGASIDTFRDTAVTFPVAFSATPIVIVTPTNGRIGSAFNITTTGFTYRQYDGLGNTGQVVGFNYIALGT